MSDQVLPASARRLEGAGTHKSRRAAIVFSLALLLPLSLALAAPALEPPPPLPTDGGGGPGLIGVSPEVLGETGWVNPDPAARSGHAMAYDSESDRVILFGGLDDETWTYDFNSNAWEPRGSSGRPSARRSPAMAYDSESDRAILFGGRVGLSPSNETWSYDFNRDVWTILSPAVSPPARFQAGMAYDSESDVVVLFGGFGAGSTNLNDTWTYDIGTNTWTNQGPAVSPSPRSGHAMAYSSQADRVVLFGGIAPPSGASNQTWTYDVSTNAWSRVMPAVVPAGRFDHALAYDAASDRVILFGGRNTFISTPGTWGFDASNGVWTTLGQALPPIPRFGSPMAYDMESDRVILFSGRSGVPGLDDPKDTWSYDLESEAWTVLRDSPPPLREHAMAYDSESDRIVLFGGALANSNSDGTWAYDADTTVWTRLFPAISPKWRTGHAMAYDSESDRIVLFGGCCSGSGSVRDLNDTWAYDYNSNTWMDLSPGLAPAGRFLPAMAYDAESDRVIMFGGSGGDETWAYDFNANTWKLLAPVIRPSPRSGHAMAYDSESDVVILFGGSGNNETWAFDYDVNLWVPLLPLDKPSARSGHSMAYDAESDRVVLFGGSVGTGFSDETWSYDFNTDTWTHLAPPSRPSARSVHATAYDSQSDRVIVFGGRGASFQRDQETWWFRLCRGPSEVQLPPPIGGILP